jgi:hypothetical protein
VVSGFTVLSTQATPLSLLSLTAALDGDLQQS